VKNLILYRQMESLYRLRAQLDEINRELLLEQSRKWLERAEAEIESYLLATYEGHSETMH
jgi:hypothetical protein